MTGSLSPNHFNTLIKDLLKDGAKFLCEYSSKHQVISKIERSGKVLIHSRLWQFSVRPQDVAAHPILSRPTASQIWELVNKIDPI